MAGLMDIIGEMRATAPPGLDIIDGSVRDRLHQLTGLLLDADHRATTEYERFLRVKQRELDLSEIKLDLRAAYVGKRVLVTGGTGCIGQALIAQLKLCEPASITSLSRGKLVGPYAGGVRYLNGDIAVESDVDFALAQSQPDVVFHLAAQRSPWLAERAVQETVMTNVIGTRNVLQGCRRHQVHRFVYASTGKAMRYLTTDVYAATKKLGEWLVQEYAAEGRLAGSGRFTHVVDNGVILEKIQEAIDHEGVCRIHEPDIEFYVQSAIESAQLLLLAGLNTNSARLRMVAIRCLGDPVGLVSMTLGMIGRSALYPPLYFSGYEAGYERGNPPGLYDPRNAADFSPLINALEAEQAREMTCAPAVDEFQLRLPVTGAAQEHADCLQQRCELDSAAGVKSQLVASAQDMARQMFASIGDDLHGRLENMARRSGSQLPCAHTAATVPSVA